MLVYGLQHKEKIKLVGRHGLQYPESYKGKKFVALVVKSVIFPGLQNSKKKKSRESGAPDHDKQWCNDIAGIATAAAEGQSDDRKKYKVCSASKISELVEFKTWTR